MVRTHALFIRFYVAWLNFPPPKLIRVKGPSSEILKFHKEPIRKVVCGAYGTVKIRLSDKGSRKKFFF